MSDNGYDSDETICELDEISTYQESVQRPNDDIQNFKEITRGELINFVESELSKVEPNLNNKDVLYENNSVKDFVFTETALFDEQYLKNSEPTGVLLHSNDINISVKNDGNYVISVVEKIGPTSSEHRPLDGLTENLEGILGNGDIKSFIDKYTPTKVQKPCSPPLTLTTPPHRIKSPASKVFPCKLDKESLIDRPIKKILPTRKSLSVPYFDARVKIYKHQTSNENVDISTNISPEIKHPSMSETKKEHDEIVKKKFKLSKVKGNLVYIYI